ncbi:MAG: hypothetical protein U0U66_04995 [Cytophagaceae bacterium]
MSFWKIFVIVLTASIITWLVRYGYNNSTRVFIVSGLLEKGEIIKDKTYIKYNRSFYLDDIQLSFKIRNCSQVFCIKLSDITDDHKIKLGRILYEMKRGNLITVSYKELILTNNNTQIVEIKNGDEIIYQNKKESFSIETLVNLFIYFSFVLIISLTIYSILIFVRKT